MLSKFEILVSVSTCGEKLTGGGHADGENAGSEHDSVQVANSTDSLGRPFKKQSTLLPAYPVGLSPGLNGLDYVVELMLSGPKLQLGGIKYFERSQTVVVILPSHSTE